MGWSIYWNNLFLRQRRPSVIASICECRVVRDNFIPSVSLLTADIFNRIFPYVRNSAEWQKRSVWGVKYVNLLSWAAPLLAQRRPRHTPTRRIKEMLMRTNLCAFLWFRWIEPAIFPFMARFCLEIEVFPMYLDVSRGSYKRILS